MVGSDTSPSSTGRVNVAVGNVKPNITINDGIYYIFQSEYTFSYFYKTDGTTNEYFCKEPRLGFKIRINPDTLSSEIGKLSPKPSQLYVDTVISYTTTKNFDMVSDGNPNTVSPKHLVYSLVDRPEYTFESEDTVCSYHSSDDGNTGSVTARTLLYEEGENSLLEFTKSFSIQEKNKDTYFNVFLPFELKKGFPFEDYKSLTFDFFVSLNKQRQL